MLILGHAGLTLGVAALLSGVLGSILSQTPENNPGQPIDKVATRPFQSKTRPAAWFASLGSRIDIRFL
ncbi:MAG: hypothetical protein V3R36_02405, partial [Dehalococcoidales bacterium]